MARQDRIGTRVRKHSPKSSLKLVLILAATFLSTLQSAPGHATLIFGTEYNTIDEGWFWAGPCNQSYPGDAVWSAWQMESAYRNYNGRDFKLNTRAEAYENMVENMSCKDGTTRSNEIDICSYRYLGNFRSDPYNTYSSLGSQLGITQEWFKVDYSVSCKDHADGFTTNIITSVNGIVVGIFEFGPPTKYYIRIVNQVGSSVTGMLADVEPGKDITLTAQVYNQNNQLVPNVNVEIKAEVIMKSGGHNHHDSQRPKGKLNNQDPPIVAGSTGAGGFTFTFNAPAPAGDHTLKARCTDRTCTQQGPDQVWVGVKDLMPLNSTPLYALVGSKAVHPDNHYLTNSAQSQVVWLAQLYREELPNDPVLHLNDASLERGGLFDLSANWTTQPRGHKTHRFGVAIDIRANSLPGAIPTKNFKSFQRYAREVKATLCPPDGVAYVNDADNRHYHVCLMGGNCCEGGNR